MFPCGTLFPVPQISFLVVLPPTLLPKMSWSKGLLSALGLPALLVFPISLVLRFAICGGPSLRVPRTSLRVASLRTSHLLIWLYFRKEQSPIRSMEILDRVFPLVNRSRRLPSPQHGLAW